MLFAGLRHLDRVRGTGWLDCPNCHEHAAQDVIDDMTFVEALGYRFTPVARRRVLVCRRCGFRRKVTHEEMARLETGGGAIRRALMLPLGVLGIAAVAGLGGLVWYVSQSSANALANTAIQFTDQTAQVFPVSFRGPSAWNYNPSGDTDPPYMKVSDAGGRMYFAIRRVTDAVTPQSILANHFTDEVGITTTGFPEKPPDSRIVKMGGQTGIAVRINYTQGAENDQQDIYVVTHNGVGYVITYVALGDDAIKTMLDLASVVNDSIKFTNGSETPPPAPSASPSPGSSASPSPSASASATPKR
jgi:hypothetical protein